MHDAAGQGGIGGKGSPCLAPSGDPSGKQRCPCSRLCFAKGLSTEGSPCSCARGERASSAFARGRAPRTFRGEQGWRGNEASWGRPGLPHAGQFGDIRWFDHELNANLFLVFRFRLGQACTPNRWPMPWHRSDRSGGISFGAAGGLSRVQSSSLRADSRALRWPFLRGRPSASWPGGLSAQGRSRLRYGRGKRSSDVR